MRATHLLLFSAAFLFHPFALRAGAERSIHPIGGPPSIRIADKAKGVITRAEWNAASTVKLAGCVPSAQVVEVTLCIKDCKGKDDSLSCKGDTFLSTMKTMVANLPDGTTFTVRVKVIDGKGKSWEVPEAVYAITR